MRADLVVLDDLHELNVRMVLRGGQVVAKDGLLLPVKEKAKDVPLRSSMNINWDKTGDLKLAAKGTKAKVIGVNPDSIVTESLLEEITTQDGLAVADVERDILKMAVIERHLASGNVGLGFVKGLELKRGALGSSVAHDSHNLVLVGTNDADMLRAAREIERMRGGLVAVADGRVLARLPLPIAGLMSEEPFERVNEKLEELLKAAHELGSSLHDPFMTLSFLALPVIPSLKLTDKGLVDVTQFKFVPLFEE
jgi:adenine deaminase